MHRLAILTVALFAVTLAACSHKATITTSNGTETLTTSGDNKTETITTKEGTVTVGQNAVDLSKLGVPIYPGSQQVSGLAGSGMRGSGQMVSLKTGDSFDKVFQWYKSQLPTGSQQMTSTTSGSSFAEFVIAAHGAAIMLSERPNETDIVITQSTTPAPAAT
jgi:hypothetical protein